MQNTNLTSKFSAIFAISTLFSTLAACTSGTLIKTTDGMVRLHQAQNIDRYDPVEVAPGVSAFPIVPTGEGIYVTHPNGETLTEDEQALARAAFQEWCSAKGETVAEGALFYGYIPPDDKRSWALNGCSKN